MHACRNLCSYIYVCIMFACMYGYVYDEYMYICLYMHVRITTENNSWQFTSVFEKKFCICVPQQSRLRMCVCVCLCVVVVWVMYVYVLCMQYTYMDDIHIHRYIRVVHKFNTYIHAHTCMLTYHTFTGGISYIHTYMHTYMTPATKNLV